MFGMQRASCHRLLAVAALASWHTAVTVAAAASTAATAALE